MVLLAGGLLSCVSVKPFGSGAWPCMAWRPSRALVSYRAPLRQDINQSPLSHSVQAAPQWDLPILPLPGVSLRLISQIPGPVDEDFTAEESLATYLHTRQAFPNLPSLEEPVDPRPWGAQFVRGGTGTQPNHTVIP